MTSFSFHFPISRVSLIQARFDGFHRYDNFCTKSFARIPMNDMVLPQIGLKLSMGCPSFSVLSKKSSQIFFIFLIIFSSLLILIFLLQFFFLLCCCLSVRYNCPTKCSLIVTFISQIWSTSGERKSAPLTSPINVTYATWSYVFLFVQISEK